MKSIYLILLLILTAYLSISAFEVVVVGGLLYTIYKLIKKEISLKGTLTTPLIVYTAATIAGNLIYNLPMIGRAIEEGVFQFLYLLKDKFSLDLKDFEKINLFIITVGLVSSIVAIGKFYFTGQLSPIWGGPFEVGTFFAVFAISSLGMYFYTGRKVYLIFFVYFSAFVFLSTKRNSMVGYLFTLGLFIFLYRKLISKKVMITVLSTVLVVSVTTISYLYQKDYRFKAMVEVVSSPDDKQLDKALSSRWTLFWQGVEVIKRDIKDGNVVALLVGHGVFPGARLEPKSVNGTTYESVIFISELTSRGLIGLLGIMMLMFYYYSFLFKLKDKVEQKDAVVLSVMMPLSVLFAGSIFSVFWDALMPLYFLMFGLGERYFSQ